MKKVIINGANGKMGKAIARIIKASPQLGLEVAALREAGDKTAEADFPLSDLEIYNNVSADELWSGKGYKFEESIKVTIPSHGAKAFYLK